MNELIQVTDSGTITARELYDFLELDPKNYSRWAKTNIEENEFAEENSDYWVFVMKEENPQGGRPSINYHLTIAFAKKLCMLSKSERGEQARNYFIEVEKRFKGAQSLPQLTPAQLIAAVAQQAADQEQKLLVLETRQEQQAAEIQGIRDIVALNPNDWRRDATVLINKIAHKLGGNELIQDIRKESYKLLDERFGVNLKIRLNNKRKNLLMEGASKSKISSLNYLDVIAEDKKLIEGYIAIIKDMAIKYGS